MHPTPFSDDDDFLGICAPQVHHLRPQVHRELRFALTEGVGTKCLCELIETGAGGTRRGRRPAQWHARGVQLWGAGRGRELGATKRRLGAVLNLPSAYSESSRVPDGKDYAKRKTQGSVPFDSHADAANNHTAHKYKLLESEPLRVMRADRCWQCLLLAGMTV